MARIRHWRKREWTTPDTAWLFEKLGKNHHEAEVETSIRLHRDRLPQPV